MMGENAYYWSIVTFAAVLMIITGILYVVERKKYILLWCASWFFFMLSYVGSFLKMNTGHYFLFTFLENTVSVMAFWAITAGTIKFFRGKVPKLITGSTLILCLFFLAGYILKFSEEAHFIPRILFGGVLLIYTGMISLKIKNSNKLIRYIQGSFFILWGLSNFLFTLGYFLNEILLFYSLYFLQYLPMVATISLQAVYFQHSREQQLLVDEKLKKLVMYDTLTGVYNRGFCELEIEKIDEESRLPISIIMGDLNGLKLINDTFGHKKGDLLLSETADILKKTAEGHIIGRWGGDEFIIVLAETGLPQANKLIRDIKSQCEAYSAGKIPLDISLGAAEKKHPDQSIAEVIEAADTLLYQNKLEESQKIKTIIVNYLKNMLLDKNIETEEHLIQMKRMASLMARDMKLSSKEHEDLVLAAFLHDIGKISTPEEILNKPGALTPEEWEIMKRHPEIGYRITLSTGEFAHISQAILSHHEHWDGKGYPQGLQGNEIPLASRIIAVIDAYDAMTNDSIYKKTMRTEEALEELERCAGTQFDPNVVNRFVRLIKKLQFGRLA